MNGRVILGTLLIGCLGCNSATPPPPAVEAASGTVTLEIMTGEEVQTIEVADVADGTTLEAVMKSIDEIPIELRGSGTTAFVDAIGATQTSASEGWTFKVDGKWADTGVGTTILHPPTTVTWAFGDWDKESTE